MLLAPTMMNFAMIQKCFCLLEMLNYEIDCFLQRECLTSGLLINFGFEHGYESTVKISPKPGPPKYF